MDYSVCGLQHFVEDIDEVPRLFLAMYKSVFGGQQQLHLEGMPIDLVITHQRSVGVELVSLVAVVAAVLAAVGTGEEAEESPFSSNAGRLCG